MCTSLAKGGRKLRAELSKTRFRKNLEQLRDEFEVSGRSGAERGAEGEVGGGRPPGPRGRAGRGQLPFPPQVLLHVRFRVALHLLRVRRSLLFGGVSRLTYGDQVS